MALRQTFGGMSQRFGCVLSLCLLMLAILVSSPMTLIANGGNMPAVAIMAEPQPPVSMACHSALACPVFEVPADRTVARLRPRQPLRFFSFDIARFKQFGPSTDTPPPRA